MHVHIDKVMSLARIRLGLGWYHFIQASDSHCHSFSSHPCISFQSGRHAKPHIKSNTCSQVQRRSAQSNYESFNRSEAKPRKRRKMSSSLLECMLASTMNVYCKPPVQTNTSTQAQGRPAQSNYESFNRSGAEPRKRRKMSSS